MDKCGVMSPGKNPYPCWRWAGHDGDHENPKRGLWDGNGFKPYLDIEARAQIMAGRDPGDEMGG